MSVYICELLIWWRHAVCTLYLSSDVRQQVVSAELSQRLLQHVDLLPLWLLPRPLTPRLKKENLCKRGKINLVLNIRSFATSQCNRNMCYTYKWNDTVFDERLFFCLPWVCGRPSRRGQCVELVASRSRPTRCEAPCRCLCVYHRPCAPADVTFCRWGRLEQQQQWFV